MKSMSKYLCLVWILKFSAKLYIVLQIPELCPFYCILFVLLVSYFVTLHKALLNHNIFFSLGNDFWVLQFEASSYTC